ncbi:hypothetical protein N0V90_001466 [Kalmusia sp. IMI 367209]|nr:hypothetical protein N0V90_001466 [Kalmusia sp. IMI 367209]
MKLFALIALAAAALAAPSPDLVARDSRDSPEIPGVDDKDFISTVLNAHWYWRRIHCAQDLQWNSTLAKMAQDDHRAGSNLSGVGPSPSKRKDWIEMARTMVHGWHEEEAHYDYAKRDTKDGWEIWHFTQLVWRDSSQLGCAVTDCTDTDDITFPGRLYCCKSPAAPIFELHAYFS